jgi:hypothetical protein
MCKLGPSSRSLNVTVSILTLVALTVDRSIVIIYPLRQKLKNKKAFTVIMCIWLVGLVMGVFSFFNYELKQVTINDTIHGNETISYVYICNYTNPVVASYYLFTTSTVQFIIPFFMFTLSYLTVLIDFKKSSNNMNMLMAIQERRIQSRSMRNRKKALKMILTFYLVYLVCWTPIESYSIIQIFYCEINL